MSSKSYGTFPAALNDLSKCKWSFEELMQAVDLLHRIKDTGPPAEFSEQQAYQVVVAALRELQIEALKELGKQVIDLLNGPFRSWAGKSYNAKLRDRVIFLLYRLRTESASDMGAMERHQRFLAECEILKIFMYSGFERCLSGDVYDPVHLEPLQHIWKCTEAISADTSSLAIGIRDLHEGFWRYFVEGGSPLGLKPSTLLKACRYTNTPEEFKSGVRVLLDDVCAWLAQRSDNNYLLERSREYGFGKMRKTLERRFWLEILNAPSFRDQARNIRPFLGDPYGWVMANKPSVLTPEVKMAWEHLAYRVIDGETVDPYAVPDWVTRTRQWKEYLDS